METQRREKKRLSKREKIGQGGRSNTQRENDLDLPSFYSVHWLHIYMHL